MWPDCLSQIHIHLHKREWESDYPGSYQGLHSENARKLKKTVNNKGGSQKCQWGHISSTALDARNVCHFLSMYEIQHCSQWEHISSDTACAYSSYIGDCTYNKNQGDKVVEWWALSPYSEKGCIPLCKVCTFSMCLHGLSPGPPVSEAECL